MGNLALDVQSQTILSTGELSGFQLNFVSVHIQPDAPCLLCSRADPK